MRCGRDAKLPDYRGARARLGRKRASNLAHPAACRRVIGYCPGVSSSGWTSRRSRRKSCGDRKRVGEGKRGDFGGRRFIKKKKEKNQCKSYDYEKRIRLTTPSQHTQPYS